MSPRQKLDYILREGFENRQSRSFAAVNNLLVAAILYSVLMVILESVESLRAAYSTFFTVSEAAVLFVFGLEYAANLYVARPRRAYVLSVWGIIDLVSIIPSFLIFMPLRQLKVARVLRVLRFLRIVRLLKLTKSVSHNINRAKASRYGTFHLDIQIYGITVFAVLVISSTLLYYFEKDAQPDRFTDIPTAMWWATVTMTTVGYGDYYPVTLGGRLVGAATALVGLALFAMLTSVVGKVLLVGLFGSDKDVGGGEEAAVTAMFTIPDQIRHLATLRDQGILEEDEFQSQKKDLLNLM